jgi:hypothetical protein
MPRMTGRCLCGRIQYSVEGEPILMRACHCKDSQRFTGSAFLTAVAVPDTSIVISGEPKTYTQPGGTSGLQLHRRFCPSFGLGEQPGAAALHLRAQIPRRLGEHVRQQGRIAKVENAIRTHLRAGNGIGRWRQR